MRFSAGSWFGALALLGCNDIGLPNGLLLPSGAFSVPAPQTLEGGGQVRISASGFQDMLQGDLAVVSKSLAATDVCVPGGSASIDDYCYTTSGAACGAKTCAAKPSVQSVGFSVLNGQTLRVTHVVHALLQVPIKIESVGSCTASVQLENVKLTADVALSINSTSGELIINVTQANGSLGSFSYTGCGTLPNVPDVVAAVSNTFVNQAVANYGPLVQDVAQSILPNPGVLGKFDAGLLLLGESRPEQPLEISAPNGGYAQLVNGGLSFGVITGFNADANPSTRGLGLASEAAECATDVPLPDLASWGLPATTRGTYRLAPSGGFLGSPDASDDVVIGVSQRALNLAGAHSARSGVFCGDYDDTQIASLHRDVLDDLLGVPLAAADARLQLKTRPTSALALEIGDNTEFSPALTARLPVAFTLSTEEGGDFVPTISMTAELVRELPAEITTAAGHAPRISLPPGPFQIHIDELSSSDARYAAVAKTQQRALLGTVAELVWGSFVRSDLILLQPRVAGYQLTNVRLAANGAGDDKQLLIAGSLYLDEGESPAGGGPALPAPVVTSVSAESGDAASVRAAVLAAGEGLPVVTVALPKGPQYVWHIAHGSSGVGGSPLKISDRSFAWQGAHQIEVRARIGTDDSTTSAPTAVTAVIDYAPPTIFADSISVDGSLVTVPARDAVTPTSALRRTFGRVGGPVPTAGFINDETVDLGALADADEVMLYVEDETNHIASVKLRLHGSGSGDGEGGVGGSDGSTAEPGADGGGSGGTADGGSIGEAGESEAGAAAAVGGAGEPSRSGASDDGGCGCHLHRSHGDRASLVLAAMGLLLLRRRTPRA